MHARRNSFNGARRRHDHGMSGQGARKPAMQSFGEGGEGGLDLNAAARRTLPRHVQLNRMGMCHIKRGCP
jgi:hypothetical protein